MEPILAFLNNPAFLTVGGVIWGLVCKYNPALKSIPNAVIPYATAAVAFLVKVFGPAEAQAGPLEAMVVGKLAIGGFFGGLLAAGVSAGWQAIQNSLIYEVFLRTPAASVLRKP